jgi:hypothetical protein
MALAALFDTEERMKSYILKDDNYDDLPGHTKRSAKQLDELLGKVAKTNPDEARRLADVGMTVIGQSTERGEWSGAANLFTGLGTILGSILAPAWRGLDDKEKVLARYGGNPSLALAATPPAWSWPRYESILNRNLNYLDGSDKPMTKTAGDFVFSDRMDFARLTTGKIRNGKSLLHMALESGAAPNAKDDLFIVDSKNRQWPIYATNDFSGRDLERKIETTDPLALALVVEPQTALFDDLLHKQAAHLTPEREFALLHAAMQSTNIPVAIDKLKGYGIDINMVDPKTGDNIASRLMKEAAPYFLGYETQDDAYKDYAAPEFVKLLQSKGADFNHKNNEGMSAAGYLRKINEAEKLAKADFDRTHTGEVSAAEYLRRMNETEKPAMNDKGNNAPKSALVLH